MDISNTEGTPKTGMQALRPAWRARLAARLAARYTAFEQTRHARYMQIALAAICAAVACAAVAVGLLSPQLRMDAGGVAFCAAGMMCVCLWLLGADDGYNGMMRKVVLATAASQALLAAVLCGVSRLGLMPGAGIGRACAFWLAQALLSGWMFAKLYKARHNDAVRAYVGKWKLYQYVTILTYAIVLGVECAAGAGAGGLFPSEPFAALVCVLQFRDLYLMGSLPEHGA